MRKQNRRRVVKLHFLHEPTQNALSFDALSRGRWMLTSAGIAEMGVFSHVHVNKLYLKVGLFRTMFHFV